MGTESGIGRLCPPCTLGLLSLTCRVHSLRTSAGVFWVPEAAGQQVGQAGEVNLEGQDLVYKEVPLSERTLISQSGPSRTDSQLLKAIVRSLASCSLPPILFSQLPTLLWGLLGLPPS